VLDDFGCRAGTLGGGGGLAVMKTARIVWVQPKRLYPHTLIIYNVNYTLIRYQHFSTSFHCTKLGKCFLGSPRNLNYYPQT
jgi:hypothetical protein